MFRGSGTPASVFPRIDAPDDRRGDVGVAGADRLRIAVTALICGSALLAALLAPFVSVGWSARGSILMATSLAAMLIGGLALRQRHPQSPLGDIAQALALIMLAGLVCGATAMLAIRSGAPLADEPLRAIDSWVGLSAQTSVERMAMLPRPILDALHIVYETSFPQIALAAMTLPLLGRSYECWRMVFVFAGASLSSALICFLFPALGSYVDATAATISAMPRGAGTYAFAAVAEFRSADHPILGLGRLAGVITFPSVHTVLALLAIQAWWWHRYLRWPVMALNLLVIVTTIPMGGHYFVDLLGGVLVWWAWSKMAVRVAASAETVAPERRLMSSPA